MLTVIIILSVVLAISLFSEIHALGAWFWLLITHGLIIETVGSSAEHMPMLAGLIIVAIIVIRRRWSLVPFSILAVLAALCLVMTAAALAGLDPAHSLVKLLQYWKGFMLALLVAGTITSDSQIKLLTQYCLAGVAIGLCVTFYEYFTGAYVLDASSIQRAGRLYGDPNVSATLILIGLPLAVYWAVNSKRRFVAIACFSLIGLIIAGITLTQSRGGFVALSLILLLLYLRKPSIRGLVLGLAIVGIGILVVPADYWDRIGTLDFSEDVKSRSLSLRAHFLKVGIAIFLDNPALGVGMGNFGTAMIATDPAGMGASTNTVAHNMYLEFFVENGVFAGLVFLALFSIALLPALRYEKCNKSKNAVYGLGYCVALSLLSILINGLFLSLGKNSVLWFLVGLSMTFHVLSKSREKGRKSRYPIGQLSIGTKTTTEGRT